MSDQSRFFFGGLGNVPAQHTGVRLKSAVGSNLATGVPQQLNAKPSSRRSMCCDSATMNADATAGAIHTRVACVLVLGNSLQRGGFNRDDG